jgi:hypothetical protein
MILYLLYMTQPNEITPFIDRERAIDRARLSFTTREARRTRGVAWSGLDPHPAAPRSDERLVAAARTGLAAAQAWAAGRQGAFLCAVATAQKALVDAHAAAEQARAAAARSLDQEQRLCEQALGDLQRHARTLSRSLRAARRALAEGSVL